MERPITEQEVKVYRLCHHDFGGLSTTEAGILMGLTPRRIEQILASFRKKAPQLFPILTGIQAKDYHLYCMEGWTLAEIAEDTDRAVSTVAESIAAAVEKGMLPPSKCEGMIRYKPGLDHLVKEIF